MHFSLGLDNAYFKILARLLINVNLSSKGAITLIPQSHCSLFALGVVTDSTPTYFTPGPVVPSVARNGSRFVISRNRHT